MKATHASATTILGIYLATALAGCGGSPPPASEVPVVAPLSCSAYQTERAGACVYTLEDEQACMDGEAAACTLAGHRYLAGDGVSTDEAHAVELYRRACTAEAADACGALAELYEQGRGVTADIQEAGRLYATACHLGDGASCTNLGVLLSEDNGVGVDATRSVEYFERGCNAGELHGCASFGASLASGFGVTQDTARGVELLARACDAEVGFACNYLGHVYEFNTDVPQSGEVAFEYYRQACELSEGLGCFNVGRVEGEGNLMAPDLASSRESLHGACQVHASEPACRLLAALDAPAPTADQTTTSCTQPPALTLGVEASGSTEGAVNGLTATCGLTASSPDRVYTLRITRPTRVKVDLHSMFDGVVHVRRACAAGPESQVACNDDVRGDAFDQQERHSSLEVDLARGTYFVVVDGYGTGASGAYRLLVDRAPAPQP